METRKRIAVLGGGESGTGAALLAAQKGYDVFLSEMGQLADAYRQQLDEAQIPYEEGGHSREKILAAELIIKSPGIPDTAPLVVSLKEKGTPVIDELSFALGYTTAQVIAITGTNGKTTTTLLTYHLLKEAGFSVGLAGNVGISLARLVAQGNEYDWLVLEVSSFQLDSMPRFKPAMAILLNITPDHLDRYEGSFEKYIASKMQISDHLGDEDAFIFNGDDAGIRAALLAHPAGGQYLPVLKEGDGAAAYLEDSWIRIKGPVKDTLFPYEDMVLKGRHNQLNAACAILAAFRAGASEASIRQALLNFVNAPHRLEKVADVNAVEWINDSKATNVDAAWYALDAMQKPVIWIAGGTDKGNDYRQLEEVVRQKVHTLICLGKNNEKLLNYFKGKVPAIYSTNELSAAISLAASAARPGDVVLLSPACASFDLFKNYADRGDQFRRKVRELKISR